MTISAITTRVRAIRTHTIGSMADVEIRGHSRPGD
jgi:hypothetical protein